MKVGVINIRSLAKKVNQIQSILAIEQVDILIITETWLKPDTEYILNQCIDSSNEYRYHHVSRTAKIGGGVAIISREELQGERILSHLSDDGEFLVITVVTRKVKITIAAIYRPPSGNYNEFFNELTENILASSIETQILLLGDFNLDLENRRCAKSNTFCSILLEYNLEQIVKKATHEYGKILDLIICSNPELCSPVRNEHVEYSDHHLLTFTYEIAIQRKDKTRLTIYDWNNTDWKHLETEIDQSLILNLNTSDPNEMAENFIEILQLLKTDYVPTKTKVVKNRFCNFYDKELADVKRKRRKLERVMRVNPGLENETAFKEYLKKCKDLFREKKLIYFSRRFELSNSHSLKFRELKRLAGEKQQNVLPLIYSSDYELAENFNQFFIQKVRNLVANVKSNGISPPLFAFTAVSSFQFQYVTIDELEEAVRMVSNANSREDILKTIDMKRIAHSWKNYSIIMINNCIDQSKFPKCLKRAVITPLFKDHKLDQNVLNSYRPIANLMFISKVFERILYKQLDQYLSSYNLLDEHQSAYRKHFSTETALLKTTDDLLTSLDNKRQVLLIALDLSAAFDTIDHKTLRKIMKNRIGMTNDAVDLILSYLENRTQIVAINDVLSNSQELEFGVPQGSLLGPLLFSIYLTPLNDIIGSTKFSYQVYADDTTLYCEIKNESEVAEIERSLVIISNWFSSMGLMLNESKSQVINLATSKSKGLTNGSILIGNSTVKLMKSTENSVKSLGCLIDRSLSLKKQIDSVCGASYHSLRKLYSIRFYLDFENRNMLARMLVLSRLDYCNSLYSSLPNYLLYKLQKVQNSACRFVFGLKKSTSITPYLHDLHWLPIKSRVIFKVLTIVHKCIFNPQIVPSYLSKYFSLQKSSSRFSERTMVIKKPLVNTNYGKRTFRFAAAHHWNSLPCNLKLPNETEFRKQLKTYLFNQYYYETCFS